MAPAGGVSVLHEHDHAGLGAVLSGGGDGVSGVADLFGRDDAGVRGVPDADVARLS